MKNASGNTKKRSSIVEAPILCVIITKAEINLAPLLNTTEKLSYTSIILCMEYEGAKAILSWKSFFSTS